MQDDGPNRAKIACSTILARNNNNKQTCIVPLGCNFKGAGWLHDGKFSCFL